MGEFFGWLFGTVVIIVAVVFGVTALNNYDTRETLKINNERCGTVAALAGANEWETNYEGQCYFSVDGKLEKVEIE